MSILIPRCYQDESHDALINYWLNGGGHGLVVLPTGTGKSLVIAMLIKTLREKYNLRIFMLTHVKELIEQDLQDLCDYWPDAEYLTGVYSAGIGRKDVDHPIIFGGVQSVVNNISNFGKRDIALIDEAQTIPHKRHGSYSKILQHMFEKNPHFRVGGLTATPFRMSTGHLTDDWGEDKALFNDVVFNRPITWFIDEGYLCNVFTKRTETELDTKSVPTVAGDFAKGKLEAAVNKKNINEKIVNEMFSVASDRQCWMVAAAGVSHAKNFAEIISVNGRDCAVVFGDDKDTGVYVSGSFAKASRAEILDDLRNRKLKAVSNKDVLLVGTNIKPIDYIACARPTKSAGLWTQLIGRGTRITNDGIKSDCLVSDFARNGDRLGPIDKIDGYKKRGDKGSAPVKDCPECAEKNAASALKCRQCGYKFPEHEVRVFEKASDADLLSRPGDAQAKYVYDVKMSIIKLRSQEKVIKIAYNCGVGNIVSEMLFFDRDEISGGYKMSKGWWSSHSGNKPFPKSTYEAMARKNELRFPAYITSIKKGKYDRIVSKNFTTEAVLK